jgi:hypothetical protein
MPRHAIRSTDAKSATPSRQPARHWLLLVHQLPASPSNLRVRTWRRLQQLGALAIKQSVYVLPDSPASREDFEWLRTEIEGATGEASVFAADSVDAWSDDALVEEFRQSRQAMYASLAEEVERALRAIRRSSAATAASWRSAKQLDTFRERFAAIERIDFFGSAGRDRIVTLLDQMEQHVTRPRRAKTASARDGDTSSRAYHARLWVTRPRPGVDRMASAWLIRRFIDQQARFAFVADASKAPADALPFDMFGVEYTHRGDQCTFEMLVDTFGLDTAPLARIAAIVHDLDLKDARFGAPEAVAIGTVIDGLQLAHADDGELLEHGMTLFESLHRSFAQSARLSGPRAVSRRGTRTRK